MALFSALFASLTRVAYFLVCKDLQAVLKDNFGWDLHHSSPWKDSINVTVSLFGNNTEITPKVLQLRCSKPLHRNSKLKL